MTPDQIRQASGEMRAGAGGKENGEITEDSNHLRSVGNTVEIRYDPFSFNAMHDVCLLVCPWTTLSATVIPLPSLIEFPSHSSPLSAPSSSSSYLGHHRYRSDEGGKLPLSNHSSAPPEGDKREGAGGAGGTGGKKSKMPWAALKKDR